MPEPNVDQKYNPDVPFWRKSAGLGGRMIFTLIWFTVIFTLLSVLYKMAQPYYYSFDSVAGCLVRRKMTVLKYARYSPDVDWTLKDFAFQVETPNGRELSLNFPHFSRVRSCQDKVVGIRMSNTSVIYFDQPVIHSMLENADVLRVDQYSNARKRAVRPLETVADFLDYADVLLVLIETQSDQLEIDTIDAESPNQSLIDIREDLYIWPDELERDLP